MYFSNPSIAHLLAFSALSAAHPPEFGSGGRPPWFHSPAVPPVRSSWDLKDFKTLVAFGDSYTDDSRLNYFIANGGQAPPAGWVDPPSISKNPMSASGGYQWPQFVRRSTGVSLYNYAVSGAVCSNDITPRFLASIDADFPAIAQYELPAFIADSAYVTANGTRFFDGLPQSTVYSMWIGTNDLGVGALLTDSQVPGKTIADYLDCVYDELEKVYLTGAKYFVLFNIAPLNLAPLYGLPGEGGVGNNPYWPLKEEMANLTEVNGRMLETVATVNQVYEYRTAVEVLLKSRFAGAKFAVFNVHDFWTDIINNPSAYLNGTAPLNVTGYISHCNYTTGDCVRDPNPDSFFWFDELHASQETARVTAEEFVNVVKDRVHRTFEDNMMKITVVMTILTVPDFQDETQLFRHRTSHHMRGWSSVSARGMAWADGLHGFSPWFDSCRCIKIPAESNGILWGSRMCYIAIISCRDSGEGRKIAGMLKSDVKSADSGL
nr:acetylesterase [Quercus suber]